MCQLIPCCGMPFSGFPCVCILTSTLQWMPDGRKIVTSSSTGEFTVWNGSSFNYETVVQVFSRFEH